ncbi:MAG: type I-B CRISPR-associated protein Cas5 [Calditrichaeota bacterium]|nr:type I-B CRISPR-associated protein Cas5 [Calditrichota bacterium]
MKTIVFDLWGDWAHFKKFYTTASPLSFHFPPITVLKGILGALLGYDKDPSGEQFYLNKLEGLFSAVQIVNPIKTSRMGYNWIETKKAKFLSRIPSEKGRYQTIIEVLKDPYYRIYVAHPENKPLMDRLKNLLIHHQCIYTPYLGISEHLANFRFVEETEATPTRGNDYTYIHSIISVENLQNNGQLAVQIEEGRAYQRDRIPVAMNAERMVTRYESVIYEMNGNPIKAKPIQYWKLGNGVNLHFFQ